MIRMELENAIKRNESNLIKAMEDIFLAGYEQAIWDIALNNSLELLREANTLGLVQKKLRNKLADMRKGGEG